MADLLEGLHHALASRYRTLGEAGWLQQSAIYREDADGGSHLAEDRARILAQTGDADEALDEIERLLAGPSWLSVQLLRLDPRWDPIREHPRFGALLGSLAPERWHGERSWQGCGLVGPSWGSFASRSVHEVGILPSPLRMRVVNDRSNGVTRDRVRRAPLRPTAAP